MDSAGERTVLQYQHRVYRPLTGLPRIPDETEFYSFLLACLSAALCRFLASSCSCGLSGFPAALLWTFEASDFFTTDRYLPMGTFSGFRAIYLQSPEPRDPRERKGIKFRHS